MNDETQPIERTIATIAVVAVVALGLIWIGSIIFWKVGINELKNVLKDWYTLGFLIMWPPIL